MMTTRYSNKRFYANTYGTKFNADTLENTVGNPLIKYAGINKYLASLLDPWQFASEFPDTNMTTSIVKRVFVSTTYTTQVNNEGIFVVPWHSPSSPDGVRFYGWDPVTSTYNFVAYIAPDEDIRENFSQMRFVSGGCKFQSATVTGNNFTVAGTFSAINYQEPPSFRNLNYQTLLSYTRDDKNGTGSVPVATGVAVIAMPNDDHEFITPDSAASYGIDVGVLTQFRTATDGAGWTRSTFINPVGQIVIFDSDLSNGMVPPNNFGWIQYEAQFSLNISNFAVNGSLTTTYEITETSGNAATYAVVTNTYTQTAFSRFYTGNQAETFRFKFTKRSLAEVTRIRILVTKTVGTFDVNVITATGSQDSVSLSNLDYYRKGFIGPGSIVAFRGTNAGQQIALAGVYNYEVVPNSSLNRNIPTTYNNYTNIMDIEVAQVALANDVCGCRFVYPLDLFMKYSSSIEDRANREYALLQASDFSDSLRSFYNSIKPYIRQALPIMGKMAGTAIGAATGNPELSNLGMSLGSGLTQFFASDLNSHVDLKAAEKKREKKKERKKKSKELKTLKRVLESDFGNALPYLLVDKNDVPLDSDSFEYVCTTVKKSDGSRGILVKLVETQATKRYDYYQDAVVDGTRLEVFKEFVDLRAADKAVELPKLLSPLEALARGKANIEKKRLGLKDYIGSKDFPVPEKEHNGVSYVSGNMIGTAGMLDKTVAARLTAYRTGDSSEIMNIFRELGTVFGQVPFIVVGPDRSMRVEVIVSDHPIKTSRISKVLKLQDYRTLNETITGNNNSIHIDMRFQPGTDQSIDHLDHFIMQAVDGSAIDLMSRTQNIFISFESDYPFSGSSWLGALAIAAELIPCNFLVTGSLFAAEDVGQLVTSIADKFVYSTEVDKKLLILNPEPVEFESAQRILMAPSDEGTPNGFRTNTDMYSLALPFISVGYALTLDSSLESLQLVLGLCINSVTLGVANAVVNTVADRKKIAVHNMQKQETRIAEKSQPEQTITLGSTKDRVNIVDYVEENGGIAAIYDTYEDGFIKADISVEKLNRAMNNMDYQKVANYIGQAKSQMKMVPSSKGKNKPAKNAPLGTNLGKLQQMFRNK